MEKIKSFKEFINENNIAEKITASAFNCVYESESGKIAITVNEGFVQELQNHIRATIDVLIKEYKVKANKVDSYLEKNLDVLVDSFKKGESPEETAKAIA
jgi:citrate lyase gamma subunit